MAHQITGIDHVQIAVADPLSASEAFRRLGFFLSPPLQNPSRGSLVRCLSFGDDHVELIGADGDGPGAGAIRRSLAGVSAKMTGIGLGSRDIGASVDSLRRSGLDLSGPSTPSCFLRGADGVEEICSCSIVGLPDEQPPGLPAFLCERATSDIVRRPEWQDHPNTARGIVSLTVLLDNPEAEIAGYNRLFGPAASTPTDETVTVHTGHGLIFLVSAGGFDDLHPSLDVRVPTPPALVVLTIGVSDIVKTAKVLAENGVSAQRRGGHLGIPAAEALGLGLEFVEV
ncbi:MAG TPA: VOC family protein [Telmatospirillum sp.]|nr:VOC family protein [Telmatospirillum sp.]